MTLTAEETERIERMKEIRKTHAFNYGYLEEAVEAFLKGYLRKPQLRAALEQTRKNLKEKS